MVSTTFTGKLRQSIRDARQKLQPFLEKRKTMVELYLGEHYGRDARPLGDRSPVNMFRLAIDIYVRSLAAANPRVTVVADTVQEKPTALLLELATNRDIRAMDMADTQRRVAKDACFGWGIGKVAVAADAVLDGEVYHGRPYYHDISFDDFVLDVTASRMDRAAFIGDYYYASRNTVREFALFNKEVRESVGGVGDRTTDKELGMARTEGLSRPSSNLYADDEVRLLDIYLPRENVILTLADDFGDAEHGGLLREQEWTGPQDCLGPYHTLSFGDAPDQLIPAPPTINWIDLQWALNVANTKLIRQMERQKNNILFRAGAGNKDAEALRDASDGEMIPSDDPKNILEVSHGGPSNINLAFALNLQETANYMMGNLDSLGGLSAQSDTVGQEQLLAASASRLIGDMQDRLVRYTKGVVTALAYHRFQDPLVDDALVYRMREAGNMELSLRYTADKMRGKDLFKYRFEVDPYSMAHTSPQQQLATLRSVLQQDIIPMLPVMQQQGINLDPVAYLDEVARLAQIDLAQIIDLLPSRSNIAVEQLDSLPHVGTKPANTTRTNVRVNRTAGSRRGRTATMIQSLMGKGVQPSESRSALLMGGND